MLKTRAPTASRREARCRLEIAASATEVHFMNLFADFQARIVTLLEGRISAGQLPVGLDLGRFVVEPPRDAAHGDLSTNAAMGYAREAKAAGSNARALAEALAAELMTQPEVETVEVAGPGFINIRLRASVGADILRA